VASVLDMSRYLALTTEAKIRLLPSPPPFFAIVVKGGQCILDMSRRRRRRRRVNSIQMSDAM
jgi:hypothetical protein